MSGGAEAVDLAAICNDLEAEEEALDDVLGGLPADAWDRVTPAPGWTVRDVVAHLSTGERLAAQAATDPAAFAAEVTTMLADLDAVAAEQASAARAAPSALVTGWRRARAATLAAARAHSGDDRIPWVTGEMGARSFVTARLMETWAHGVDIREALGIRETPTARLRRVADLGVRTRRFAFANRGLAPPDAGVRVELDAPGGGVWTWGGAAAPERVSGTALDFCLVVTQRRGVDETDLACEGAGAAHWMQIAQAFAGPPTRATRRPVTT